MLFELDLSCQSNGTGSPDAGFRVSRRIMCGADKVVKKIDKTTLTKRKTRGVRPEASDLREQFVEEAAAALRMLLELMANSDTDAVRLKAAQDILDRAGFKPIERREVASVTGMVNTSIDYSDPAQVEARIEELRKRLDKGTVLPRGGTGKESEYAPGCSREAAIPDGNEGAKIEH